MRDAVARIWSPGYNVWLERRLWYRVAIHQRDLGLDIITAEDLAGIAAACVWSTRDPDKILERIDARERITRHDVKARLEIACEDAGNQRLHLGMTSADVVENTMAIRVRESVRHIGRVWGVDVSDVLKRYRFRGIRGPMGTAQDQVDLLGSIEASRELDRRVADDFDFCGDLLDATGQVAHRSAEFDVISSLASWLPLERGDRAVLRGYVQMLAEISGNTWNEGDVSQSVVRRVAIPNALDLLYRAAFTA